MTSNKPQRYCVRGIKGCQIIGWHSHKPAKRYDPWVDEADDEPPKSKRRRRKKKKKKKNKKSNLTAQELNLISKKLGRPKSDLDLVGKNIMYPSAHIAEFERIRIERGLSTQAPVFRAAIAYAMQWVGEW